MNGLMIAQACARLPNYLVRQRTLSSIVGYNYGGSRPIRGTSAGRKSRSNLGDNVARENEEYSGDNTVYDRYRGNRSFSGRQRNHHSKKRRIHGNYRGNNNRKWHESKEPSQAKILQAEAKGDLLYGTHVVKSALTCQHREVHQLYLTDISSKNKKSEGSFDFLSISPENAEEDNVFAKIARKRNIPISYLDKWTMNSLVDQSVHQGVILEAEKVKFNPISARCTVDKLPELLNVTNQRLKIPPIVLALDEINDAHNMGALLRTSLYLGCAGIITSSKNCAPLSPAVARSSAGALDVLAAEGRLFAAHQLPILLNTMSDNGWTVLGAHGGCNALLPSEILDESFQTHTNTNSDVSSTGVGPIVLVVGNEHSGLRTLVRRACDHLVRIPRGFPLTNDNISSNNDTNIKSLQMRARMSVDSLNVSVATGILLSQMHDIAMIHPKKKNIIEK